MDRHLEGDWAILKDRYDLPEYIRFASVTWSGNYITSKILRRLQDTERYANLGESDEIPDRQLRKAIEKACSLLSRHACTYAQYKFGATADLRWLEKEKHLLSETKIGYYFPGVQDRLLLRDISLEKRDYCDKIVHFLSGILDIEMFLRDHSNRTNSSLYIRMNTDKLIYYSGEPPDKGFKPRHKDLLIHSTALFNWMYSDYEHDVAVIW